MNPMPEQSKTRRRDFLVAAACGAFVAAMVGAAYAAVPLYSWFCRTTGFGGTPVVAHGGPVKVLDRKVTVRFDANVASGLPWKFEPEQVAIDVRIGEVVTVYYRAINDSARETVGQAGYNVTPSTVGGYFAKINCFCFTEQRLKPHERRDMAVVFYVDPALASDSEEDDLNTITLSYTMYPVQQPEKPVVENARPAGPGRI
ncbi:MAG TPA: cytochrome c oxidase assembly protein [Xanthobacteraceae bacterium]|jgi:cytochrome c oxidase assembly protein subunit 11|nr:cytochrome c oxidase assembly protein [Xanthobacteraceae bacterium]